MAKSGVSTNVQNLSCWCPNGKPQHDENPNLSAQCDYSPSVHLYPCGKIWGLDECAECELLIPTCFFSFSKFEGCCFRIVSKSICRAIPHCAKRHFAHANPTRLACRQDMYTRHVYIYIYIDIYIFFQKPKPIFLNLKEKIRAHRASSNATRLFLTK